MMRIGARWRLWLLCGLMCLAGARVRAQDVQPVPALQARVTDLAGVLSAADRQGLEDKLAGFEQAHGSQIVILLVPTTKPEDIFSYANRVAQSWKVGRKGVGDGLVIVVATQDKRVRIEVARALEGAIPDLAAKRVIREAMGPRFEKGDFAGGLNAAVDQLIGLVEGEQLPAPAQPAARGDHNDAPAGMVGVLFPLFIGALVVGSILSRVMGKGGSFLTSIGGGVLAGFVVSSAVVGVIFGMAVLLFTLAAAARTGFSGLGRGSRGWGGPTIFGGGGGGSWGGSSGGGGGFSSGGGGDFSGGGASGSWGD